LAFSALLLVALLGSAGAATNQRQPLSDDFGVTTRVSINSAGEEGNEVSMSSAISANGRYVAFVSYADNLVPDDTNGVADIFVHDRQTGVTKRVSVNEKGEQANGPSYNPSLTPGGFSLVFESEATNLVANDKNGVSDIFYTQWPIGTMERISLGDNFAEGNGPSHYPRISSDGMSMAFYSEADNLVPDDKNGVSDVFVVNWPVYTMTRVSVSSGGVAGNSWSNLPAISVGGYVVTFRSNASNLVSDDSNNAADIFAHDLRTGQTRRVSVSSSGQQADGTSLFSSISDDGRYVAFGSWATNLVVNDTNDAWDVFVHDRDTGYTRRVSVNSAGEQANADTYDATPPVISADGRYVAFDSDADNLVEGDTGNYTDVFLHDRQTAQTTLVSRGATGSFGQGYSSSPAISAFGHFVAFDSDAANLVSGDSNMWGDVFVLERPNNPPVAEDLSVSTAPNQPVNFPLVATDADGDPLYVFIVSQPQNGYLNGSALQMTYTPISDFLGTDSFTFQANDGAVDSNVATVTITVVSPEWKLYLPAITDYEAPFR
jgi:hypothetical protein